MTSIANPQPEFPAAEELVAYLDGELPPEDCRRVEERLAADADYRQQLRDLDQAWEALDALPKTKTDDDFARTTMELLTVAAEGDVSQETARAAAARRSRARWWASSAIAAAIVGFIAVRSLVTDGNRSLLADLPVIRQVDLLGPVDDIEFLRQLPTAAPLEKLMNDDTAVERELSQLKLLAASSREARRRWIEALSPEQKASLAAQANRFSDRSRDEQERLRQLDAEISQANDADALRKTLVVYGQWLARLTPGEQEQLRMDLQGLATDKQMNRVQRVVRQEIAQASRRLSADEIEMLRAEVLAIATERRAMLLSELRRRGDGPQRLEGPRGALMILNWELRNDGGENNTRQRLMNQLSPESRAHLERLSSWGRRAQLWQWVRDSLQHKWGQGELEGFFADKLDNNQREHFLSLPPAEMQAQLERLYLGAQLGYRESEQWWNEIREPGGRPRNPPGRRPDIRPNGPPRERERSGEPRGEPPDLSERDRFDRGPDRPRGPRRDDLPERQRPPRPEVGEQKAI